VSLSFNYKMSWIHNIQYLYIFGLTWFILTHYLNITITTPDCHSINYSVCTGDQMGHLVLVLHIVLLQIMKCLYFFYLRFNFVLNHLFWYRPTKQWLFHILVICLNESPRHFRYKVNTVYKNIRFKKNMLLFQKSKNAMPLWTFSTSV
jgi:hypothetical protein